MNKSLLITGGAGFIGSHVVRHLVNKYPSYMIVNADKLTYAGNLQNLTDIENADNYRFEKIDIVNEGEVFALFDKYMFEGVIHLAAESHVDRSISTPNEFVYTNIVGTVNLLNASRKTWNDHEGKVFYHISTDEVYGSLGPEGLFTEDTPYDPRSPYSASKASSDHFVRAYHNTYGLPVIISNCSNNYGPNQFPEKLIPLAINNIKTGRKVPVYGKGENIRDWVYVEDHAEAIDIILHKGVTGETYNIGGNNEWKNIDLVYLLCELMDQKLGRPEGESASLITFVKDRAGHDKRYAIDSSKIATELGWKPAHAFREGLSKTIDWYLDNQKWLQNVLSGDYEKYYEEQYLKR
ncbi:MAG TPA: dTDP-glucose 4,6-dehydratase [Bacteroidales bacterium]|nr:dTDP-glucose 4,6-dehydratase [Bacteroidales bacterium]